MTYMVYDINGYVGDLASGGGLSSLRAHLYSFGAPIIKKFIDDGSVELSKEFRVALQSIPVPTDKTVMRTLANFRALVNKCEDVVIITDGVLEDSEDADTSTSTE